MRRSPAWLAACFVALFIAYQLPEGLGRWLDSAAVNNALMLAFLPIAFAIGRFGLGGVRRGYALSPMPRALFSLLALACAAKAAALVAGARLGVYHVSRSSALAFPPPRALLLGVLLALVTTFVPSMAEDLVTRGFWFAALPARLRRVAPFTLLSALIFTLNHIYRLGQGPAEWARLFAFGLACAAAVARSGSLWAAVGLHWGWNLANALVPLGFQVEVAQPAQARLASIAAHLAALVLVLIVPTRLWAGPARQRDQAR